MYRIETIINKFKHRSFYHFVGVLFALWIALPSWLFLSGSASNNVTCEKNRNYIAHISSKTGKPADAKVTIARGKQEILGKEGIDIQSGDSINPTSKTNAAICCSQSGFKQLFPGVTSGVDYECNLAKGSGGLRETEFVFRHGGTDLTIPFVISPRFTYIIANKDPLIFRWNSLGSKISYKVRLYENSCEILAWEKPSEISQEMLVYSKNEEPLEPGSKYFLHVEASDKRNSWTDSGNYLGFEVLSESRSSQILKRKEEIDLLSDPIEKKLRLEQLYSSEGLFMDAINSLKEIESASLSAEISAAVYERLGRLYARTGLNKLAEDPYIKAIDWLNKINDPYHLAITQANLAGVQVILGKQLESDKLQETAIQALKKQGYEKKANELKYIIEKLKKDQLSSPSPCPKPQTPSNQL